MNPHLRNDRGQFKKGPTLYMYQVEGHGVRTTADSIQFKKCIEYVRTIMKDIQLLVDVLKASGFEAEIVINSYEGVYVW